MTALLLLALALPARAAGPRTPADFAFGLFEAVSQEKPKQNFFLSPVSARWALGMAYAGSAGETQRAMAVAMGAAAPEVQLAMEKANVASLLAADPKVILKVANSMWLKEGYRFNKDYLDRAAAAFRAEVFVRPFSAGDAKEANDWVSKRTEGKIQSIIQRFEPADRALLLNAVYFKGRWSRPFDSRRTQTRTFYGPIARQAPMMTSTDSFEYFERPDLQAVRLPYGSGRLGMIILLPAKGKTVSLTGASWRELRPKLAPMKGTVTLPRFKIAFDAALKPALTKLGMGVAFDPQADFTPMSESPNPADRLHISAVVQKTFVEVNEEGTEAAAATGVTVGVTSYQPEKFTFTADRPFVYLIEDGETGEILFIGALRDPK